MACISLLDAVPFSGGKLIPLNGGIMVPEEALSPQLDHNPDTARTIRQLSWASELRHQPSQGKDKCHACYTHFRDLIRAGRQQVHESQCNGIRFRS